MRDDDLAGKVAVITGAASGIGQALAAAYARAGVISVLGYYPGDPHDVQQTVDLVEESGGSCVAIPVDVCNERDVETLADAATDRFGRLDYAVAAAGILRVAELADMTDDRWSEMLDVDLTGVLRTFRSCAARMRSGGSMVAVSSIAGGVYGMAGSAHYAAAKAGVIGLCRSLAVELAPRTIRVNAVIPGLVETPQSLDEVNAFGPEGIRRAATRIPLGRVAHADEVARTIRFLTSSDASYVTGTTLIVDGGLSAWMPL